VIGSYFRRLKIAADGLERRDSKNFAQIGLELVQEISAADGSLQVSSTTPLVYSLLPKKNFVKN